MSQNKRRAERLVNQAWDSAIRGLKQMNNASVVRPSSASSIFQLDQTEPSDEVKFVIGPVVFFVPEKAKAGIPDLYIVVKGDLSFEIPCDKNGLLKTKKFGTKVAYFRSKSGALEHIYGAHYDMETETKHGHPIFHGQLDSYLEYAETINQEFRLQDNPTDRMDKILRTVRVPIAQMDIFSVMTQICADHLMYKDSGPEVKEAFQNVRKACDFLVGAAHRMPFLNQPPATSCYRSTHWYMSPAANQ